MSSHQFWADELAEKAINRHQAPYTVSDWKTPSGHVHVGSLRGVLVHDAVARALKSRGVETRYIFGFDDKDPFDKVPNYLNQEAYAPFLGKPFPAVPAPDADGMPMSEVTADQNFARFYADEFESVYRKLGVESETLRTSELYATGMFNDAIQIALDHAEDVRTAYETIIAANRSADRRDKAVSAQFPLNVVCEACGRVATTEVTGWNGETVSYVCRDGVVAYVGGCGHQGVVSPFNGNAKLPWKVEWAAKWWFLQLDVEGAGKDHYTKGGSRDVAAEIFRQIYAPAAKPGYDRIPEDLFYEWFYLGGKKMSTSKGVGIYARDILHQVPAELLRFLMVRVRPRTGVDFDPTPTTVSQLYDEYDRILAAANADPASAEMAIMRAAAIEPGELPQFTVRFSKVLSSVQHGLKNGEQVVQVAAEQKGSPLSQSEQAELERRVAFAELTAQQSGSGSTETAVAFGTSDDDRRFLSVLLDNLQSLAGWTEDTLKDAVSAAIERSRTATYTPRNAYRAIYVTFLNAEAGPRAPILLEKLGKDHVVAKLTEVVNG